MAKNTILGDAFEQLAELGQSTAKKTVKSMAQIVNPFSPNESNVSNKTNSPEVNRRKNHTPVDFDKFKNKFQDKDKLQAEALSRQFFQNVKREDEKILQRQEMEAAQKKRQEEYEEQEKKKKEQQQKSQGQQIISVGKTKRGVAVRKRSSEQLHVENKPASGKQ